MTTGQEYRRLTKSRTDRMIDGVCGGVAAYFGIDPTLVRVAWVLVTLLGGSGIILYIAAMFLMPKAPVTEAAAAPDPTVPGSARSNTRFWGIILIVVGAFWMMGNLDFDFWHNWWWLSFGTVVPVLLILAGVAFLFGGREYVSASQASGAAPADAGAGTPPSPADAPASGIPPASAAMQARLTRSRTEKKVAGVCGGLALWLHIDPVFIRLAFVMAAIASFGFMLLIYILLAIALPVEAEAPAPPAVTVS